MVMRGGFGRTGRGVEFDSLGSGCILRILMSLFYASLVNILGLLWFTLCGEMGPGRNDMCRDSKIMCSGPVHEPSVSVWICTKTLHNTRKKETYSASPCM